jgi:hypothetical protein
VIPPVASVTAGAGPSSASPSASREGGDIPTSRRYRLESVIDKFTPETQKRLRGFRDLRIDPPPSSVKNRLKDARHRTVIDEVVGVALRSIPPAEQVDFVARALSIPDRDAAYVLGGLSSP